MTESESDTKAEAKSERTGTLLIAVADKESTVLKDVHFEQVHALSSSPDVSGGEAVRGTVALDPPMNVSWQLVEIESRWIVSVERSTEPPATSSRDITADNPNGEPVREERVRIGRIHALSVPDDMTKRTVDDVLDDREDLLSRATRFGVSRVEIHSWSGAVVVRYMPRQVGLHPGVRLTFYLSRSTTVLPSRKPVRPRSGHTSRHGHPPRVRRTRLLSRR